MGAAWSLSYENQTARTIALSAFAALNMIQVAFTGFCPAAMLFKALGLTPGTAFR